MASSEHALKKLGVFEWLRQFKEKCQDVHIDARGGKSKTMNRCKCRKCDQITD